MQSIAFDTKIFGSDVVKELDVIRCAKVQWRVPSSSTTTAAASTSSASAATDSSHDDSEVFNFYFVLAKHPNRKTLGASQLLCVARKKSKRATCEPEGDGAPALKRQKIFENSEDEWESNSTGTVARLQGVTLPRKHLGFIKNANMISSSLHYAASTFFNYNGERCRVTHQKLRPRLIKDGDFLYIDLIESAIPGIDLGLHLLHNTFLFLREDFGIAVMEVASLTESFCEYEINRLREREYTIFMNKSETTAQEAYEREQGVMRKIRQHFARLGFDQTPGHPKLWFLTNTEYFSKSDHSKIPSTWLSKEKAALKRIEASRPPPRSQLDEELYKLMEILIQTVENPLAKISNFPFPGLNVQSGVWDSSKREQIRSLVNKGASVNNSQTIHLAAANCQDLSFFEFLVSLGGDVNALDGDGRRPLHVAAGRAENLAAVKALLSLGADKKLKDKLGKSPKDTAAALLKSYNDFRRTEGLPLEDHVVLKEIVALLK